MQLKKKSKIEFILDLVCLLKVPKLLWYLTIQHKIELYQAHRQMKKLKGELGEARSRLKEIVVTENNSTSLNNSENNDELGNAVNKIIEDNNLGSTIFMSTDNYLKLILTYPFMRGQLMLHLLPSNCLRKAINSQCANPFSFF